MTSPHGLFLTDLDGTLLAPDGSVPARNLEAMRRADAGGVELVIATGRRRSTIRREHAKLPGLRYRVSASNGAVLLAEDHETPLEVTQLPWASFHTLCEDRGLGEAVAFGITLPPVAQVHDEEPDCVVLAAGTRAVSLARSTADEAQRDPVDLPRVTGRPLLHVAFLLPSREEAEEQEAHVREAFDGTADVHVAKRPNGSGFYLEAVPRGGKGLAVRRLAAEHGLAPDRIGAVGDDMNDGALLDAVGHRYAVGGSVLASRRADAHHVAPAAEGSVADALERFLRAMAATSP